MKQMGNLTTLTSKPQSPKAALQSKDGWDYYYMLCQGTEPRAAARFLFEDGSRIHYQMEVIICGSPFPLSVCLNQFYKIPSGEMHASFHLFGRNLLNIILLKFLFDNCIHVYFALRVLSGSHLLPGSCPDNAPKVFDLPFWIYILPFRPHVTA